MTGRSAQHQMRLNMTQNNLSYEKAFERLETILELMNSGKVPLEESIELYEEAEKLMQSCQKALNTAEKKIEQLTKERNGEVALGKEGQPQMETFNLNS